MSERTSVFLQIVSGILNDVQKLEEKKRLALQEGIMNTETKREETIAEKKRRWMNEADLAILQGVAVIILSAAMVWGLLLVMLVVTAWVLGLDIVTQHGWFE